MRLCTKFQVSISTRFGDMLTRANYQIHCSAHIPVYHGSAKHCCKSGLKMNRKTPISDLRGSVTPDPIDLKFGRRDYVVGATQHAKT